MMTPPEFLDYVRTHSTVDGGYPIYAVMDDGALLCRACANLPEVHIGGEADGWRFDGAEVYWEGPEESCAHCGTGLPSAYGDPDETEED